MNLIRTTKIKVRTPFSAYLFCVRRGFKSEVTVRPERSRITTQRKRGLRTKTSKRLTRDEREGTRALIKAF